MSAYWITFRIDDSSIGGRSYDKRYLALQDAVQSSASKWWVESTSFIAFEAIADIAVLARAFKTAIAPSHDLFLIRQMDTQSAIICGKVNDKDIFNLMPYLKVLE